MLHRIVVITVAMAAALAGQSPPASPARPAELSMEEQLEWTRQVVGYRQSQLDDARAALSSAHAETLELQAHHVEPPAAEHMRRLAREIKAKAASARLRLQRELEQQLERLREFESERRQGAACRLTDAAAWQCEDENEAGEASTN